MSKYSNVRLSFVNLRWAQLYVSLVLFWHLKQDQINHCYLLMLSWSLSFPCTAPSHSWLWTLQNSAWMIFVLIQHVTDIIKQKATNRSTSWLHLARFAIRRAFLMLSSQPSSRKTESWKSSHLYFSSFHRNQPPYQLKITAWQIISVLSNIIINFDSIFNY